jgi:CheY-like chemotaxis protein
MTKPVDRARLSELLKRFCPEHSTGHVLIVDDEDDIRGAMRDMLEHRGWHVSEARNGREGLACLTTILPDLILLDLMMPEIDGFQFAAEIRKNDAWRTIPIVVITARDLKEDERRALNGQVKKVLVKGTSTREQLLTDIRELLAKCTASKKCAVDTGVRDA